MNALGWLDAKLSTDDGIDEDEPELECAAREGDRERDIPVEACDV